MLNHLKQFSFCGYYAAFNFYSTYSNVVFDFSLYVNRQLLPFEFNASFAVIDKNFITYIQTNTKLSLKLSSILTNWNHFHNYIIEKKMTLLSFFIKTKKMYQVVFSKLYLFHFTYFIFDGPGFTSTVLSNKQTPLITSIFQCVLQIMSVLKAIPSVIDVHFYHKPQNISKFKQIEITETIFMPFNLLYQTRDYLLSIIAIQIKAPRQLQVNVTVLHIFSSILHNSECIEWGFLTIEYLDREYEESITLCLNHSMLIVPSRSFYSINYSLIILFYSYPGAGEVKVSGEISTTKCQPVHFDPCVYYLLKRDCKAVQHFKPYLPHIVKFLNISLIPRPTSLRMEEIDLLVNLEYTQCVVLQIGNKVPVFLNLTYSQRNCLGWILFKTGCISGISFFDNKTSIDSVKGQISEEELQAKGSFMSTLSIFHLKEKSKLNKISHTLPNETFYHQFQNIKSVIMRTSIWGRKLNWIDIVFKILVEKTIPIQRYATHITQPHSGLNTMPRIDYYGLNTFSYGDISLRLSESCLKNISIFTLLYNMSTWVRIVRLNLLKYKDILIPQSMYF